MFVDHLLNARHLLCHLIFLVSLRVDVSISILLIRKWAETGS